MLIEDFAGGTRLGESLATLREPHARRLVGRLTLVLITEGLDTGEPEDLSKELVWLSLHAKRILWLNPLLSFDGYSPLSLGGAVMKR